jgi:hypothetical protein
MIEESTLLVWETNLSDVFVLGSLKEAIRFRNSDRDEEESEKDVEKAFA